jgi:hypothetical protein
MPWREQFPTDNNFGFETKYKKGDISQLTTEYGMCGAIVVLWLRGVLVDGVSSKPNEFESQILQGKWTVATRAPISNATPARVQQSRIIRGMLEDANLAVDAEWERPSSHAMSVVINEPGAFFIATGAHAIGVVTQTPNDLPAYYFLDPNRGVRTTFQLRDLRDVPGLVERDIGNMVGYSSAWTLFRVIA